MIEAVTFDLWNTLVEARNYEEYRLPTLKRFLENHGVTLDMEELRGVYLSGFMHSSEIHRTTGRKHVPTEEIVGHVMEKVGLRGTCDWSPVVKAYEEAILRNPPRLREDVHETLSALEGKVGIGLISDTGISPGRVIRVILEDYGVLRYFKALKFSDEVGWCKPNEIIFREALMGLDVKPGEALHVGDLIRTDIVGAKGVGMRTAWLRTNEQGYSETDAPDYVLTRLTEVIGIVKSSG